MPKVSIVLPTYNGEKYIRESIESIIAQTFQDWELIIVNDCSTDGTASIIQEYREKDSRIKIVNNIQNQKLPRSLNIGFREAVGKYLTWTSDDNYYLPNAIEKMTEYLDDNSKIPMVCAGMETIDGMGMITGYFVEYSEETMFYNDCVGACFMYRRSVLTQIGGYNPDWLLVEDYEYWLRILRECGQIGYINQVLYRYRYHESSLTGTKLKDIKTQLYKLRTANIEIICERLKNNVKLLGEVYIEMCCIAGTSKNINKFFIEKVPAFGIVCQYRADKQVVIYGAGDFGNRAFEKLGDNVINYVDSNSKKIGTYVNGKLVISLEEYMTYLTDKQLLVAVSSEKVGQLICDLYDKGITKCSIYQNL